MGYTGQLIIAALIAAPFSYWVYADCLRRGTSRGAARLWSIGTFLLLIIFFPLYVIVRAASPKQGACR